tara:strand:- start:548 stop:772 length:225 start_codon:yes stop_codon:yes gene_type:complete
VYRPGDGTGDDDFSGFCHGIPYLYVFDVSTNTDGLSGNVFTSAGAEKTAISATSFAETIRFMETLLKILCLTAS